MRISQEPSERQVFVAETRKNTLQAIRAHIIPSRFSTFVDLRVFERQDGEGTEHPTTAGLRFDAALLPQVAGLLEHVREHLRHNVIIVQDQDNRGANT